MEEPNLKVVVEKLENLERSFATSKQDIFEQLRTALDSHQQLHQAHEKAHSDEHSQTQRAVERAEATTMQIAHDHEAAHTTQHIMTKEQGDKADLAYEQRLGSMSTQTSENYKRMADRIEALERENAMYRGRDRGVSLVWVIAVGAVGVVATLVSLITNWQK